VGLLIITQESHLYKGRRVKTVVVLLVIIIYNLPATVGYDIQWNRKRSGWDMNNFGVKRVSLLRCLSMVRCNYYFVINYHFRVPKTERVRINYRRRTVVFYSISSEFLCYCHCINLRATI